MALFPSLLHLLLIIFFFTILAHSLPIHFPRATSPDSLSQEKQARTNGAMSPLFTTQYFPQVLDHFTFKPNSYRTFPQKYLLNSTFWDSRPPGTAAPIFVYTGNEGDIEWFASNTGFMFDIAPRFHALLVFIEHRFYGESMPFGTRSKTYKSAETLGYLTSEQALADFAVLIGSLKKNISANASPVIVFGGSYGGMLASWFRLKYPHIAIGALASSAPILQFDNITPWNSFNDAVTKDFKDESMNCYEVIKGSWDELKQLSTKKGGLLEINKAFRTCKTDTSLDWINYWLSTAFTYTAMADYPTPANFVAPLPAYPINQMCRIIDSFPAGGSTIPKVFAAASLYYNYTGNQTCFDMESNDDPHGMGEGWGWQYCTEMMMPMSSSNTSMFPPSNFSYKETEKECMNQTGVRPRPYWIATEYGGAKIKQVLGRFGSNIIFSNGMRDPWSRGGVLKNISSSLVALVTEKGAHHVDLRFATKDDPIWLREQRIQEVDIIHKWIIQYFHDLKESTAM